MGGLPPVLNNLGTLASIASLPALAVTYLAFIRRRGVGRSIILFMAGSVAILAYAADISDRLGWIRLSPTESVIASWGIRNGSFYIDVNGETLTRYAADFKMMEILEIPFSFVDSMTDTYIEKSDLFTIINQKTTVGHVIGSPSHLRVIGTNLAGRTVTVLVNFNLVLIPNNVSAEQIRSLSDVERVGGIIMATLQRDVPITASPQK